jgi:hypothetical protein
MRNIIICSIVHMRSFISMSGSLMRSFITMSGSANAQYYNYIWYIWLYLYLVIRMRSIITIYGSVHTVQAWLYNCVW